MHGLHLPEVTLTYVLLGLAFGFPLTVALAWTFDLKDGRVERTSPSPGDRPRGARLALLLAGIGVAGAAPGLGWYFFLRGSATQAARAPAPSIVVLPFVNLSPEASNEYFSDGLTDELIDALAHIDGLQVVSRTSAFSFKGKQVEVGEIGARLKVATVLEGSVRRDGSRLRLTAQLINVSDGFHLWSQTYERELKDVFAVEAELAQAIAATLRPRLVPSAQAAPPTRDPEAHDLYLRGRYFWNRRTPDGLQKAISLFEGAIERDGGYAPAYAGLADSYLLLIQYAGASTKEMLPKARAAAKRALELDPDCAEGHATLGLVVQRDYDWKLGEAEFRRAIALAPASATAHLWYGNLLSTMGRVEEARREVEMASRLDPTSIPVNVNLAFSYLRERRYDRAIEQATRTTELEPRSGHPHFALAVVYLWQRRFDASLAEIELSEKLGLGQTHGFRGYIYAETGRRADALRERALIDDASVPMPFRSFARALVDIGLRQIDQAFADLDAAIAQKDLPVTSFADPFFDPIRGDPRFRLLRKKMRLE
jgi:serine/threonine-protein kinase